MLEIKLLLLLYVLYPSAVYCFCFMFPQTNNYMHMTLFNSITHLY